METITPQLKKMVGYYATPRGKYLLLMAKVLSKDEFILYDASITFADWDKEHVQTFGTLNLTQGEIEYLLGRSKGYVSRYSKGLFDKGFWTKRTDGRIEVAGFELIEPKLLREITKRDGIVNVQSYIANLQKSVADRQQPNAVLQTSATKDISAIQGQDVAELQPSSLKSDLSSFKGNSLRSDEEYQRIWIEDFDSSPTFTPDDMKWIDLNVKENPAVPS